MNTEPTTEQIIDTITALAAHQLTAAAIDVARAKTGVEVPDQLRPFAEHLIRRALCRIGRALANWPEAAAGPQAASQRDRGRR